MGRAQNKYFFSHRSIRRSFPVRKGNRRGGKQTFPGGATEGQSVVLRRIAPVIGILEGISPACFGIEMNDHLIGAVRFDSVYLWIGRHHRNAQPRRERGEDKRVSAGHEYPVRVPIWALGSRKSKDLILHEKPKAVDGQAGGGE